jgi:hypothetical protein
MEENIREKGLPKIPEAGMIVLQQPILAQTIEVWITSLRR